MEAKLQEKQLKEKEEAARQMRVAAKLKEKVRALQPVALQWDKHEVS